MHDVGVNETALGDALGHLPAHWLRHIKPRSIGPRELRQTYSSLKGWGRTLFVISRGRLLYLPTKPTGCVLRRTPILAWALLETLERHDDIPDVVIPFNCRDKPTFWMPDGPQPQTAYERGTTAVPVDGELPPERAQQADSATPPLQRPACVALRKARSGLQLHHWAHFL